MHLRIRGIIAWLALVLALTSEIAWAGGFSGTFVSAEGEKVVLKQSGGSVTGTLYTGGLSAGLSGQVRGGVFYGRVVMPGAGEMQFSARVSEAGLAVEVEGETEFYRRVGGAPGGGEKIREEKPAGGGKVPALSKKGAVSKGRAYKSPYQGWGFRVPRKWKHTEREGTVMLGSDSEAGLILVQAEAVTDTNQLHQGLVEILAKTGSFSEPPPFKTGRVKAGRVVYTEVGGTAADGTRMRVRAAGVIGKKGTVAILGLTTPGRKFDNIRRRVDSIARSVHFFKPKTSPGRRFVMGEWFGYSGGSGGGTSRWLAFCPDGRFFYESESSYSGGAGTDGAWGAVGKGKDHGSWKAVGNNARGTVFVTNPDGSEAEIRYQAKRGSDGVDFDGHLYGRTGKTNYCK
jgi:hypothetical protein